MPRTLGDAVTDIRFILQDEEADCYRYTDVRLYRAINDAVSDARRLRPDLYLPSTYSTSDLTTAPTLYTSVDSAVTFPIEETYYTAIVEYVAGYMNISDDEYTSEGKASVLLGRFTQKLIGKGA